MKTILVTGATGFLGHHLVQELLKQANTKVIAILGRHGDKANVLPESERLTVYPCSELFVTDFGHVETLIHTAFSRGDNLPGLTKSIEMTERVIELVNAQNIDSLINISSQGVYKGLKPGEKVDENGSIEPNTAYGLAKWSVENMLKIGCKKHYSNIRMASLSANAHFLQFFVNRVIAGQDITVTAPNQYASIMDVSDAVDGIVAIEGIPNKNRFHIYNLGSGEQHSILDFAKSANNIGEMSGLKPVHINIEDKGVSFSICMDCSLLQSQTGWQVKASINTIFENMFNSFK